MEKQTIIEQKHDCIATVAEHEQCILSCEDAMEIDIELQDGLTGMEIMEVINHMRKCLACLSR